MKGLNVKVLLKPAGAPGCRYSGGMLLTVEAVQNCLAPMTTPVVDGMALVLQNNDDRKFEVKAEVAMPAARAMLIALYRDYFNNYLTVQTYAEEQGLHVDEARTLLELARKVDSHPHPES